MIQLETLSGQPYDTIYLNETDNKYGDILEHIKRSDYPEYNPSNFKKYTMYVKTDIKLFNKEKLINFDDDISFDKEDSVLHIFSKYEYVCLDNWKKIYNFTEENRYEKIINLIKQDAYFINLLIEEEQTEEILKLAIQKNCYAIKYVKEQTEEIRKLAVQLSGDTLYYVKEQTEEICKLAVQKNCYAIKYAKEQTEELCKLAVKQDGYALKYVKNQTEELCKLAVQKNGLSLEFVDGQTEEICKLAVQQYGKALKYVKNITEEICKLAVQQDGCAIEWVPVNMKHLFM